MKPAADCTTLLPLGLESFARIRPTPAGCLVTTSNLYPSGRAVQVLIQRVRDGFKLSDGAQALREIRHAGIETQRPGDYISPAAKRRGVSYAKGEIYAIDAGENVALLVKLVANASGEAVVTAVENYKLPRMRSFKFAFDTYIKETFGDKFKPDTVAGKHSEYQLDYVYRNNKIVIADPVTADSMSINQAYRIHSDIAKAKIGGMSQWIVYGAEDGWKKSDLEMLAETGAYVVPYDDATKGLVAVVQ